MIPLILVLVVLVPITNAVSGDGEGGTRTITQEGAFMKEINLDELDKSQEYVIADINTQTYEDRQLVAFAITDIEPNDIQGIRGHLMSVCYGTWYLPETSEYKTGFYEEETGSKVWVDVTPEGTEIWNRPSEFESEDMAYGGWIGEEISLRWDNTWNTWVMWVGGTGEFLDETSIIYVATSEPTDYIGVHSENYDNSYYMDDNSQIFVWSMVEYIDISDEPNELDQYIINYWGYTNGEWADEKVGIYYNSLIDEDEEYLGIGEEMNYVEHKPLTVSVNDSKVEITSKWDFTIMGERINFAEYNTSFTGIIPHKVTIGGNGGISGSAGTLIQMIPIFAILGILSALVIPMIRKEESI